jgi:hypothetical protein
MCAQIPALADYLLSHPQDLQDLVDMIAIHEHGEPDYDGHGNSDMPLSKNFTTLDHQRIKEIEQAKFEDWALPLYDVDDQARIHQLYLAFESNTSRVWLVQLANTLDRLHGDITLIRRRWSLLPPEELLSEANLRHAKNGLLKELPNFIRLLESVSDQPVLRHQLAAYLLSHLEKVVALGFEPYLPELTAGKNQLAEYL